MKPDCYKCVYRQSIPGDTHSTCKHPDSGGQTLSLFATLASVRRVGPQVNIDGVIKLKIDADLYGVKQGWFNWPWNYDPVWLLNCDGFEKKT